MGFHHDISFYALCAAWDAAGADARKRFLGQITPSSVAPAEPEASPNPPPASGNLSDPRAPSSRQADKAGTEPPPSVSAVPFNNPRCREPETCSHAHSKTSCHDCFLAWAQRPKDEQRRLWAEACGEAA